MLRRLSILGLLLLPLLLTQADGKEKKKKVVLPDYVLNAERVMVMIQPQSGEPLKNPSANRAARENVEKALLTWGRFRLVMDPQLADLIFVVRKGNSSGPTIANSPTDNPPVVIERTGDIIRVGTRAAPPVVTNRGPHIQNEIGPAEDLLEVYRGGSEFSQGPLAVNSNDATLAPPVWRYMGNKALEEPRVEAVEQFRKVFAEAEKARSKKP